jgi:hypothetical protein
VPLVEEHPTRGTSSTSGRRRRDDPTAALRAGDERASPPFAGHPRPDAVACDTLGSMPEPSKCSRMASCELFPAFTKPGFLRVWQINY